MKRLMITSFVLLAGISGETMAACGTPYMNAGAVQTLLNGNTACSPASCSSAGCMWQEQHRAGGALWDYKKGSNPVDPTKQVGGWNIANNGKITHNYTGAGGPTSYTYDVKDNGGGSYSFCGGPTEIPFSVKSGAAAGCP